MGVTDLGIAERRDRGQQVDQLDHRIGDAALGDPGPGDHEWVAGEARVEARRPLLDQPEIAQVLAVVGEHHEDRVVEVAGAIDRVDDPAELPVDPARHPVVRRHDLGEVLDAEVVPPVHGAQCLHEPGFAGGRRRGDRCGDARTIVL